MEYWQYYCLAEQYWHTGVGDVEWRLGPASWLLQFEKKKKRTVCEIKNWVASSDCCSLVRPWRAKIKIDKVGSRPGQLACPL